MVHGGRPFILVAGVGVGTIALCRCPRPGLLCFLLVAGCWLLAAICAPVRGDNSVASQGFWPCTLHNVVGVGISGGRGAEVDMLA